MKPKTRKGTRRIVIQRNNNENEQKRKNENKRNVEKRGFGGYDLRIDRGDPVRRINDL